jgi:hypothetical protein
MALINILSIKTVLIWVLIQLLTLLLLNLTFIEHLLHASYCAA